MAGHRRDGNGVKKFLPRRTSSRAQRKAAESIVIDGANAVRNLITCLLAPPPHPAPAARMLPGLQHSGALLGRNGFSGLPGPTASGSAEALVVALAIGAGSGEARGWWKQGSQRPASSTHVIGSAAARDLLDGREPFPTCFF